MCFHAGWLLFFITTSIFISDSFFHHSPQSINVTLGSTAEFHCQPSISDSLASWNINNMSLHMFNSSDVVSVSEQDSTWNINRSTLYVIAHHMLNNSVVHCIINSNGKAVATSEADLMIQGNAITHNKILYLRLLLIDRCRSAEASQGSPCC